MAITNKPKTVPFYAILAVLLTVLVIGVVSIIGSLSYQSGRHAIDHLADQWMLEIDERVEQHLDDFLEVALEVNQANQAAVNTGLIDLDDFATLGKYFYHQCQLFGFSAVKFGGQDGSFVGASCGASTSEPGITERSRPALDTLRIYSLDAEGERLALTSTVASPPIRHQAWYTEAVAAHHLIWSVPHPPQGPHQQDSRHQLSISASVPIYDQQHTLLGVFGVDIELNQINQFLGQLKAELPGNIAILDQAGGLIASSRSTQVIPLIEDAAAPPTSQAQADDPIPGIVQDLTQRYGSLTAIATPQRLHSQGPGSLLIRVRPSQSTGDLGWFIVTAIPESQILGQINTSVSRTIALCGLTLLITLSIGLWVAEQVTHSLLQLTQATRDFAMGQPVVMPKCIHIEEIATLADAFSQMMALLQEAEQLRQTYAETLEQQVSEKTTALQQATDQLQEAQRIAQVGSWTLDLTTRLTTWSTELFRIAGLPPTPSGTVELDIHTIVPPDDWPTLDDAVETAIAHQTPYRIEHRVILPDGGMHHVISRGEPLYDDQGQMIALAGTVADISERVEAEQALQKSEQTLSAILNSVNASVASFCFYPDQTWVYDYWSPGCEAVLGFTADELMADGELWWSRIPPEDQQAIIIPSRAHLFATEPYSREYRFRDKAGTLRWIASYLFPRRDEAHDCWKVTVIDLDVTDRKQTELALQAREARLQRLANNILGMLYQYVLYADGSEAYTYVSTKCRDIYERDPEELLADFSIVTAMVHPEDQALIHQANHRSAQTLEPLDVEFRLLPASGAVRWVRAVSQPQQQPNGDILWDGIVLDITARKQAERALQQSEAKSRALLAAMPDFMCRINTEQVCLEIVSNQEAINLLPDNFNPIGLRMAEFLPAEMALRHTHYIEQALETGDLQVYEQQLQKGSRCHHEEVRMVQCDDNEVLLIVRDISEPEFDSR